MLVLFVYLLCFLSRFGQFDLQLMSSAAERVSYLTVHLFQLVFAFDCFRNLELHEVDFLLQKSL